MKLKKTILASALLSLIAVSAQAAQELSPEKAAKLQPFERINISDHFYSIGNASDAVSKVADKKGAASYYIQAINDLNSNGGNWIVTADLYHQDAPLTENNKQYRSFNGIKELPKAEAYALQPFDTVSVNGFFRSQPDVNDAISKSAQKKGAAAFFIYRQLDVNEGGNQMITAFLYKADAPKRQVQSPDVIPRDSDAGRAALAAGGDAAKNVEQPGIAFSSTPPSVIDRVLDAKPATGKRYTVTLPNGKTIEEINAVAAAQMQPFESISITGYFRTPPELSESVAQKAAAKGAKYYHITRQWENNNGGNLTVSADLFK